MKRISLATNEEMFGDEDLESGDIGIKPENSDNVNLNLSYNEQFGKHAVYVEGGFIYRYTKDYIQRKLVDLGGGKSGAAYENHGRVETKGYTLSARYGFADWVSVGGNFTQMDVRDNVKTVSGWKYAGKSDLWRAVCPICLTDLLTLILRFTSINLWKKGNLLTVTYDNLLHAQLPALLGSIRK